MIWTRLSVFFIEIRNVSVGTELKTLCPGWRSAHLLTHGFQRHARIGFYDQLVMDVGDNRAAAQRLHGVAQDIAGNGLHAVAYDAQLPRSAVIDTESVPRTTIPDVVYLFRTFGVINNNSGFQLCSTR